MDGSLPGSSAHGIFQARMKGLPVSEPGTRQTSKNVKVVDGRIKRMWYIYTMEYYLTIKKNKILPFVATCMTWRVLCEMK